MITRFLRNLAGPSLDDEDPARRLRALEKLDPDTPDAVIAEFVLGETDAGVRTAAIARLDEAPVLLGLMEHEAAAGAARDRLAACIDAGLDVRALLAQLDDPATLRHLLDATGAEADWRAVLERLEGEDLLSEVAMHHGLAAVRAAAAERVRSEAALRTVERGARERDKQVARAVRDRLDALRAARARHDELGGRLAVLADEVRTLVRAEDAPRLAERVEWFATRAEELGAELEGLAPVFAAFDQDAPAPPDALAAIRAGVEEGRARLAREAEAAAAAEAAERARAERRATLDAVLEALERLETQLLERIAGDQPLTERGSFASALEMEERRWADAIGAADGAPASDGVDDDADAEDAARRERHGAVHGRIAALLAALERLAEAEAAPAIEAPEPVGDRVPRTAEEAAPLWARRAPLREAIAAIDAHLKSLGWPEGLPLPAPLAELGERRAEIAATLAAIEEHERRLSERVRKLCGRAERALESGNLKAAGGIVADLDRQFAALPDPDARRIERVDRIRARLEELRDWEYFATHPKREELCAAMEALAADEAVPAEDRAERVKALRAEWNALGTIRGAEGKALAERFDAAAEAAFAPAREAFRAASAQRAENTKQRKRIVEELERFLGDADWDAADWKTVERIYKQARTDWKRFDDVDGKGHALGKRYHAAITALRERLEPRWKANIARKEQLVAEARALVGDDGPVPNAARQAKDLQARWREVDITPRSEDRKLWKAFRAACDAVFKGLDAERDAAGARHRELRAAVEAAIADHEAQLARLREAGADAATVTAELPEGPLRGALDALAGDRAPPKERKATDAVVRRARRQLDAGREHVAGLARQARAATLARALEHDCALARAELGGGAAPEAPAGLRPRWREALAGRGATEAGTRRAACIDLELALGLESPAEDAELRLARQVERLNSGLRGDARADDVDARIEDAVARLLAAAAADETDLALAERALAALRTARPSAA